MEYRRLGTSGVAVSLLGLGSWLSFGDRLAVDTAIECMQIALAHGCNFFDNAESYGGGRSEAVMGEALSQLRWPRGSYLVTTKLFWGIHGSVNMRNTLNRKYLMQAMDGSLERLRLDFVDVVFCHRADPNTPMEETVWAMSDLIAHGKSHYWGTSGWAPAEIRNAISVAERHHLHKPVVEQAEYNLLERGAVEGAYARLFAEARYGCAAWSPLADGLLTGKYSDGVPGDSRAALVGQDYVANLASNAELLARVERLRPIAVRLGCTMAQLALAWCTKHPMICTVITGASRPSQVAENFAALDVIPLVTDEVKAEIEAAMAAR